MMTNRVAIGFLCLILSPLAGCTSYYRVTDPASGKTYYTTDIDEAGKAGAVKFKDEKSGSVVTLQSSEVKEVSKEEYKSALTSQSPPATPSRK